MDIPSGSKTFNVTFANSSSSYTLTLDTQRKIRLLLINPDATSTNLIKVDQRYTWQTPGSANEGTLYPDTAASIGFYNAVVGLSVSDIVVGGEALGLESSLSGGGNIPYSLFNAPANYAITFEQDTTGFAADTTGSIPGNPTLAATSVDAKTKDRYTTILFGTQGNLQAKVYTDD